MRERKEKTRKLRVVTLSPNKNEKKRCHKIFKMFEKPSRDDKN